MNDCIVTCYIDFQTMCPFMCHCETCPRADAIRQRAGKDVSR